MPKQTIKLVSWNVNGYRAVMKKDFLAIVSTAWMRTSSGSRKPSSRKPQLTPCHEGHRRLYASAFSFSLR
jgi:hypothetical protein